MVSSALQTFAVASISLYTVVGTVMGVRLLLLARRTRRLPELALGLALVMFATLGYPLSFAAVIFSDASLATRLGLYVACSITVDIGIVATAFFTWRVFRRESRLALAAVAGSAVGFAALLAYNVRIMLELDTSAESALASRVPMTTYFLISMLIFGWATFESLRWWKRLRRRVAVGLASPVVANRFFLWGAWNAGTTAISIMHVVFSALGETIHHPVPLTFSALCGIANAACLVLAFFAPPRYTAWLERHA